MATPAPTTSATTEQRSRSRDGRIPVGQSGRIVDGLIEAGIIGLFLFAPLPFGSVVLWAQGVIEGTVAFLLALWVTRMLASGQVAIAWNPLLWPGLALVAVVGLQLRPGGSVNPHATWESFRLYLAYFGLLLLLSAHLVTRRRVVRLLSILIGWGAVLAILGLANQMLGRNVVPWFPKGEPISRLVSTFINPNHQALYFSILVFLALGLVLRPRKPSRAPSSGGVRTRGDRTRWDWGTLSGRTLLVGAIALLGGALILTMSRGGLLAALVGLLVVGTLSFHGRAGDWTVLTLGGLVAAVVFFASWFGAEAVLERFFAVSKEPFADARWSVYERTLHMLGDAPLLGIGLGAFSNAFPLYRPPGIPSRKIVDYAHNDYLQLGAEVGWVGLVLLAWALTGLVAFVLRRWVLRHDPFIQGLTLGALGSLGAVAAHSFLDFGLHMPANALLAVVLGALLPAVVTLRTQRGSGGGVDLKTWSWRVTPLLRVGGVVAVVMGALLTGFAVAPPAVADWYVQRAARTAGEDRQSVGDVTTGDLLAALRDLEWAARLDPSSPSIQSAAAAVAEQLALRVWTYGVGPDGRVLPRTPDARLGASQDFFAKAYEAYQRSLQQSPRDARTHDRFGTFLAILEEVRQTIRGTSALRTPLDFRLAPLLDSQESLLPRALVHVREGVRWDPQNPFRHRSLALFALAHLKGALADQVAAEGFRQALAIEPTLLGDVVGRLESRNAPRELLAASIPRRGDLWLALARRLEGRGRRDAAALAFEEALALAVDPADRVEARLAYSRSLLGGGSSRRALDHARQALVLAPRNHEVFATLGEIYEALGEWNEAGAALGSAIAVLGGGDRQLAREHRDRLVSFYLRRGQREQAFSLRRQMVREFPNDPYVHFELGRLLEERREWVEALPEYQAAERLAPTHLGIRLEVARAYARHGLLQEAVTAYEAGVRLAPIRGDVRIELAELYGRLGLRERAVEQYREVLVHHPDHEGARRALNSFAVQPAGQTGSSNGEAPR